MSQTGKANYSIILGGFFVLLFSMGVRQSFGLLMLPITCTTAITSLDFSFILAVQNLLWGLFAFIFGFLVSTVGEKKILFLGSALVVLGLLIIQLAQTAWVFFIGAGIFMGVGLGALSFSIVLATVGKHIPAEKVGMTFAVVSSGGSIGQFLLLPLVKWGLFYFSWQSIVMLMALSTILLFPAGWLCVGSANNNRRTPVQASVSYKESLSTLKQSFRNSSYMLINIGFAICGFHVTLISVHLPHYFQSLNSTDISAFAGAAALSIIGFVNIIGTLSVGWLMKYFQPKLLLISLYGMRALVLAIFIMSPKNDISIAIFSLLIGALWLATVPLTSKLINTLFGRENLALLFGMAMLSHQIGAFFGAYSGGWFLENYEQVWLIAMFLSLLASVVHFPIKQKAIVV